MVVEFAVVELMIAGLMVVDLIGCSAFELINC
jgi:hypothetical protein